MRFDFFQKNKQLILYFLIIIAFFSFINTFSKGLLNGCDFQWQPSKLLWEGINHYKKFITQGGRGDFLCQNGEYAHLLHVLFYPFVFFEWETARTLWLLVNIFFAFCIPIVICRSLKISKYKSILLLLIFITCYPTRMTINYGQQSLFVMFFMLLPFTLNNKLSGFLAGLSYVKYSSGYVILLNFLASKQYKIFILSTIPYFLGWFVYFNYTNSDPILNFFEPLQLILQKGYVKDADIYSLTKIHFAYLHSSYLKYAFVLIIFIINFLILLKINKFEDIYFKMSLILICPLIFFPHSNYDYILLFPLLCYSLSDTKYLVNRLNIYFVMFFFYLNRIINHLIDFDALYQPLLLLVMILLLITNIYSYKNKNCLYLFKYRLI